MDNILVSIIMPVFNAEKYIKRAIDSIIGQTYKYYELIIVDDGSNDNSISIINRFADKRIIVLTNKYNSGIVYSLNRAIEKCNGKYVIRMDADDICKRNRIEKQVKYMEMHPEIGISGTLVKSFGEIKKTRIFSPIDEKDIKCSLIFEPTLSHPSVIIRNDIFKIFNIRYKNKLIEDYNLWVDALDHTKIAILPKVLLYYRVTKNNLTSKIDKSENKVVEYLDITNRMLKKCGINYSDEQLKNIYNFNLNKVNNIKIITKILEEIYISNNKNKYYNNYNLKLIFGKKWLAYIIRNKSFYMIKNKYSIYGLLYLVKSLINKVY